MPNPNMTPEKLRKEVKSYFDAAGQAAAYDWDKCVADYTENIIQLFQADHRQRAYKEFVELVGRDEIESLSGIPLLQHSRNICRNELRVELRRVAATYYLEGEE